MLGLEVAQLVQQRVVLGVRDLRVVEDVVPAVVVLEHLPQLGGAGGGLAQTSRAAGLMRRSRSNPSSDSMPAWSVRSKCSGVTAMRPVAERREVGAVLFAIARLLAVDPVAAPAALLLVELHAVAVDALAEPAGAGALHLARRAVHVQQRALGHRHLGHLLDHARHERGGLLEVRALPVVRNPRVEPAVEGLLRGGDGGDAEHNALERRGHGARVGDVVAEVGAVVDAGDDQLRLELQKAEPGEAHAVHRRAVGGETTPTVAEVHLLDPERLARGDAPRRGAPVGVGRDHRELHVRDLEQRLAHHAQADCLDAVVVGEQDLHGLRG